MRPFAQLTLSLSVHEDTTILNVRSLLKNIRQRLASWKPSTPRHAVVA
jgi:hypothetical protein